MTTADLQLQCIISDRTCHFIEDFWQDLGYAPIELAGTICDLVLTVEEHMENNYFAQDINKAILELQEITTQLNIEHNELRKHYGV